MPLAWNEFALDLDPRLTSFAVPSIVVDRRAVLPLPFPLPGVPASFPIKQLPVLASALRTSASWWSA